MRYTVVIEFDNEEGFTLKEIECGVEAALRNAKAKAIYGITAINIVNVEAAEGTPLEAFNVGLEAK